ncbi:MAG: T9SS type A sorting domain-containing protein [Phaeodactylibacter sp.]|nr:T9SS type A sorting domain-containing protein [Phaeodactylibacter sp.]MCB9276920.1 T9SS type A sorting domain-containing protein [Lewinellaceae bacterium]
MMNAKPIVLALAATSLALTAVGQGLPNEGMENWEDANGHERPAGWLTNADYPALPCYPPVFSASRTDDSNSGQWAALLETKACIDDLERNQAYIGFMACGGLSTFPQLPHGIPYQERPEVLHFSYKFHREGTDTGFVHIVLLQLGPNGEAGPVVGEGSAAIVEEADTYTAIAIPIAYYSSQWPDVLQLVFSASKTLIASNLLNAPAGSGANPGTALWIDDIFLSGNVTNTKTEGKISKGHIYPNPSRGTLYLGLGDTPGGRYRFLLFDARGALAFSQEGAASGPQVIGLNGLAKGFYFYTLYNAEKVIQTGKVLLE